MLLVSVLAQIDNKLIVASRKQRLFHDLALIRHLNDQGFLCFLGGSCLPLNKSVRSLWPDLSFPPPARRLDQKPPGAGASRQLGTPAICTFEPWGTLLSSYLRNLQILISEGDSSPCKLGSELLVGPFKAGKTGVLNHYPYKVTAPVCHIRGTGVSDQRAVRLGLPWAAPAGSS